MQRPVAALARSIGRAGHLDKAVVEAERMTYGVLPALLILSVIGKQVHDELIDLGKSAHFGRVVLNGHGDEAYVGVGRLSVGHVAPVGCVGRGGGLRERSRRGRRSGARLVRIAGCRGGGRGATGGARRDEELLLLLLLLLSTAGIVGACLLLSERRRRSVLLIAVHVRIGDGGCSGRSGRLLVAVEL